MAKRDSITTPIGVAVYPHLNRPDTKFNADGDYSVKLRLTAEDAESLVEKIDQAVEDNFAKVKKDNPKKKVKKSDFLPYDTDEETGEITLSFKLNAVGKNSKTGETWKNTVKLFDAKGKPTKAKVGGGSRVRVAAEINPYYTPTIGAGVSLRLKAVQIEELMQGGDATSYGFDEIEDGFDAADVEDDDFETTDTEEGPSEGEDGDEDYDF
jgi:hypothetical protein